ncbi:MAG: transglycosylase SLT domain-containing protein, partial [Acidobacteria bacterium]|nr:transglycosylase SLT domain-containing protein [Acidobacteriota bacterium]
MQRTWFFGLGFLLALALAVFAAEPADEAGALLAHYAQSLRARPSAEAYARLEQYAQEHRGSEWAARAALVLGLADLDQQRSDRAAENFARAAESYLLGDYGRLFWGQTLRRRGDTEQALTILAEFHRRHARSRLADAVRIEQASILVELGRTEEAQRVVTAEPNWQQRPALLLALARAHVAAGEAERAVEALHRIYYEFPLSPEAEPSNQFLAEIRPQLGSRYIAPSEGLRIARADRLWEGRAFQGARSAYLDLSVRASEPTRRRARLRAAQAFYHLGGGSRACGELGGVSDVERELEAEWFAYRAQCRLRAGDSFGFERELDLLREQFPASSWYAQMLFAGGSYFLAADDIARARRNFERLLEAFPESEWAAESHWKLAWIAYLERNTAGAAQAMEEHLARYAGSPFTPRALYWRARLAERGGELRLAVRLAELLRAHYPRHYLGQLVGQAEWAQAHGGAGDGEEKLDPVPAWFDAIRLERQAVSVPSVPNELALPLERAQALLELGLNEFASEEATRALERGSHPELHLARAQADFALGRYPQAIEWLQRAYPNYLDLPLDALPPSVWQSFFPQLDWDSIHRHARTYRVDPLLVAALMRQESRFDPRASSSAGARGLLQLMPDTARHLAGVRRLDSDRLFEPDFNIRLGTRFLRQLHDRFGGQLEYIVAAYNAGGTRVAEWRDQRVWSEPAEFVESIPASQTREFV